MTALRRPIAGCLIALVAALVALVAPVGAATPACAAVDQPHHVAIVVEHGDGTIVTACVGFATDAISGIDALASSGIEYGTVGFGGFGQAVCQLDSEPATYPPSCFSSSGPYWAVFVARGGGPWTLSSVGVSSLSLHDGDGEGFRYDPQSGTSPPPSAPGHCSSATGGPTPLQTASPRATATIRPTPTATIPGGGTAQPADTDQPTSSIAPPPSPPPPTVPASSSSTGASGPPLVASPAATTPSAGTGASPESDALPIAGGALAVLVVAGIALARQRSRAGGR